MLKDLRLSNLSDKHADQAKMALEASVIEAKVVDTPEKKIRKPKIKKTNN